ncbi:MAG: aminotransferase class I/II-fold pyridoxal phosphate-dependent enzyme [Actinomycetota bacterium]|nr:aminotransferase class I/II-fold pyridoxal phosphate-dependent enzyme [Actinomycetota bacterium]
MSARIPLSEPTFGTEEEELLLQAVRSGYVSSVGPLVGAFEEEFAAAVGSRYAVACSSGTAALHLALLAVGVQPGDDVLVSDLTFIASANPARYCRAEVGLVDAETDTWNLNCAEVVAELHRRARRGVDQPGAIVAVHVLGQPADLAELIDVCHQLGVSLIEDAAEALGASWTSGPLAGRQVGTVGRVGCFSFNGNKVITSGGGGMVVTDEPELARDVRHLATQARLPGVAYRHDQVGYNYRLTNIAAAVGLAQLRRLPELLSARRLVADRYDELLGSEAGVQLPPDLPWAARSSWLYSVLLADPATREAVRLALDAAGVEARPIWPALRTQDPYRDSIVLGGQTALDIAARGLSLPSSAQLRPADQQRTVDVVRSTLARLRG